VFNKKFSDSILSFSDVGGSYVKKAIYTKVKEQGKGMKKMKDIGDEFINKIKSYVPDKSVWENNINEAKAKGFVGKIDKMNYAVLIDGATIDKGASFGDLVMLNKKLREFKKVAKKGHVGAKGKATLASVKAWIKENKPSQYYAKWQPDSSYYKDDTVEIFYIK